MRHLAAHPAFGYLLKGIFVMQVGLLWMSYYVCRVFVRRDDALRVFGVREVANCLHYIAGAFDHAVTVNLAPNKFYRSNRYAFTLGNLPVPVAAIASLFVGPVLLGYLACRAGHFFYLWNSGFLLSKADGRAYEFAFLKKRGKSIACYFCGSDIRSPRLSLEHGKSIGYETMMSCIVLNNPGYASEERETFLKQVADSADRYADPIFNAPVDQIAYLKREAHPFLYFYPDDQFQKNDEKFLQMETIRVLHAPSSPLIKGTLLVRAAVKNLQERGYRFEYTEITEADNAIVLAALKDAHIVINELYAFVPGMFGVEAMASHCALLTSADPAIEPALPADCRDAWLLTRYWDVTEKLQSLLDAPETIKPYADAGYAWAYRHCRRSVSQQRMATILGVTP